MPTPLTKAERRLATLERAALRALLQCPPASRQWVMAQFSHEGRRVPPQEKPARVN